jgi:protein ImuA
MTDAGPALAPGARTDRTAPSLADLRRRLVEADRSARLARDALPFGVAAIDAHLPWGGLPLGRLHEFVESGLDSEHSAAATAFVGGIGARLKGTVLWCLRGRDLFAPALASVGLHPDRVVYVETAKDAQVLPAMEDALRHGGLGAVVGEVARLSLVASRRLQLAAEGSGVPALVLRRWRNDAERAAGEEPTAVFTRWQVGAAPSRPPPVPGLSRPSWRVELLRCRGAHSCSWIVEACDAEGRLRVPADLRDRPHPPKVGGEPRPVGDGPGPESAVAARPGGRRAA